MHEELDPPAWAEQTAPQQPTVDQDAVWTRTVHPVGPDVTCDGYTPVTVRVEQRWQIHEDGHLTVHPTTVTVFDVHGTDLVDLPAEQAMGLSSILERAARQAMRVEAGTDRGDRR